MAAYRAAPSASSTAFSPFFVLFGSDMVLRPIEHELKPTMGKGKDADEYIKKLLPKLEVMRKVAKQNVEEYQQRYKKHYDKNSEPSDFPLGTKVLLYNPKVPPGKTSKL